MREKRRDISKEGVKYGQEMGYPVYEKGMGEGLSTGRETKGRKKGGPRNKQRERRERSISSQKKKGDSPG